MRIVMHTYTGTHRECTSTPPRHTILKRKPATLTGEALLRAIRHRVPDKGLASEGEMTIYSARGSKVVGAFRFRFGVWEKKLSQGVQQIRSDFLRLRTTAKEGTFGLSAGQCLHVLRKAFTLTLASLLQGLLCDENMSDKFRSFSQPTRTTKALYLGASERTFLRSRHDGLGLL